MGQYRRGNFVLESSPVEHLSASMDRGNGVMKLRFGDKGVHRARGPVPIDCKSLANFRLFNKNAREGRKPLATVIGFMLSNHTYQALNIITQGNKWRQIASALAVMFYTADCYDNHLPSQQAAGYHLLRDLVISCVTSLRRTNHDFPKRYDRLIEQLFINHGDPAP